MTERDDEQQPLPSDAGEPVSPPQNDDWKHWIDVWREDMPREDPSPTDGETESVEDSPARRKTLPVFIAVAVIGAVVVVAGGALAAILGPWFKPDANPQPEPQAQELTSTSAEPVPTSTTAPPAMQCEEYSGDGKLVTGHGGAVTNPETLVAEFQHRYFDLRDGAAVAELWDTGYDAEGFQSTIDSSLATASADIEWCLTVMPAETGWWATEVSWWEEGDTKPRETWFGNYHIEQRGSGWIFTDAAASEEDK